MKVLMLTYSDWSNTGWRFYRCLQHLNLDVKFYKAKFHKFDYPTQGKIHEALCCAKPITKQPIVINAPGIEPIASRTNVLHFTSSTFMHTNTKLSNKTVIVQHGGATYRNQPDKVNAYLNKLADITIIQTPDLLNLGAKNEQYISFPVDTTFIGPFFKANNPLKIGHFPSNADAKGSKYILETINKLGLKCIGKKGNLKWTNNLKAMSRCDIIIEKMQPELLRGMSGEWGNTALEAAALGKIVITNSYKPEIYQKEYGDCPLLIANNHKGLETQLEHVLSMNEDEILKLKMKMRNWAVESHGIPATAKRLWEKIYGRINVDKA